MKLIIQENGNLEILCGSYSIWSSGAYGYNIDALHFNSECKILILNKYKSVEKELAPLWQSACSPDKLISQDDGNLVLYDCNSDPLWATGTNGKCVESKNIILFEELTLQAHHVFYVDVETNVVILFPRGIHVVCF